MSLKKLDLIVSLEMARIANGLDVPIHKPKIDTKTYGVNPKRCKSCSSFKGCQFAHNRNPMDIACHEYHKKK